MVGVDICLGWGFLYSFSSFLEISLDVEICKQNKEQGSMEQDDIAEYLGKIAFNEERKTCMDEKCHKLSHLQRCQISEIRKIWLLQFWELYSWYHMLLQLANILLWRIMRTCNLINYISWTYIRGGFKKSVEFSTLYGGVSTIKEKIGLLDVTKLVSWVELNMSLFITNDILQIWSI